MTDDNLVIHNLSLRGYRFDAASGEHATTIQTNAVGGVCVRIARASDGTRGASFTVDFADIEALCLALRAASLEAHQRLVETMAGMSAHAAIYHAQQSAARPQDPPAGEPKCFQ